MWSTRDELEAAFEQAGLEDWAARLAATARHAIILETGPVEDGAEPPPLGESRLGGMPDLPSDVPWPWRPAVVDGQGVFPEHAAHPWPLSFVAQIDFAEIYRAGELEGFPRSGRLLFFCDPVDYPWGEAAEDQARSHVIFTTEPRGRLVRRTPPEEFSSPRHHLLRAKDFVFRSRRLTPKLWLLPPPRGSRELQTIAGRDPPKGWRGIYPKDWSPAIYEAYDRFWRELAAKHPSAFGGASAGEVVHQVGGIPFSIQDPVEAECVKYADEGYRTPSQLKALFEALRGQGPDARRRSYLKQADRWQLVLQIDSDMAAGMQWGDAGRVYVCIRKDDLAACRFERCWTILQCT